MPAARTLRVRGWGRGQPWDLPSQLPTHPSTHNILWLLPNYSGTKPTSPPCTHWTNLTRGAKEAEALATQGLQPWKFPAPTGQEAGILGLAFPSPISQAVLGLCAPWNLETYLQPHQFFILIFFPRRKQLSWVYKHWEILLGRWEGVPASSRQG